MGKKDPRVDAYIAKSADFAKPILNHLRDRSCMRLARRWRRSGSGAFPTSRTRECSAAWPRSRSTARSGSGKARSSSTRTDRASKKRWASSGGSRSSRTCRPRKVLIEYIKLAKKLNDDGVKAPTRVKQGAPRAGRPRRSGQGSQSETRRLRRHSTSSAPATNASMSTGSPRPRPRPRETSGSRRRSNGWRRGRRGTGST